MTDTTPVQTAGATAEPTFWSRSNRFDPRSAAIADRHYNRQKVGTPQFVPPGRCMVLRHADDALWVTSWPFAEYTRHDWPGAWINSCFRKECPGAASTLIREAVAITRGYYSDVPDLGMVTFVDGGKVRSQGKRRPGFCYQMAGFEHVGFTRGGLWAWQMLPAQMPEPIVAHYRQEVLL